jgi:hypothetical protein
METLIDGDFASNNGGWGFSASTGVDPQPYFRIFNALLERLRAQNRSCCAGCDGVGSVAVVNLERSIPHHLRNSDPQRQQPASKAD